jgi:hypothetical protein
MKISGLHLPRADSAGAYAQRSSRLGALQRMMHQRPPAVLEYLGARSGPGLPPAASRPAPPGPPGPPRSRSAAPSVELLAFNVARIQCHLERKRHPGLALHRPSVCALEVGDETVLRRTVRDGPVAEAARALLVSCACGPATSWKARLDTSGLLRPRPARSFLGRAP